MLSKSKLRPKPLFQIAALWALALTTFLAGCGGDKPTGGNMNSLKPPGTTSTEKKSKLKRQHAIVYFNQGEIGDGDFEIKNGDAVSTDMSGEAILNFPGCEAVHIYRESSLIKDVCSKKDADDNNLVACTNRGTVEYENCASNLIIQSHTARIWLEGTRVSTTYLPELELTVLLVFTGKARAVPVLDVESRERGGEKLVPTEYFWFSVPDNRLDELKALNLNLKAREAYPFERLPDLLRKIDIPTLAQVAEQAIKDGVSTPDIRPFFPPYTKPDPVGGGPVLPPVVGTTPPIYGNPPIYGSIPFGGVKIGRVGTGVIDLQGVTSPDPSRITLNDPQGVFGSSLGAGGRLNVTFSPKDAGVYSGSLTYRGADGHNHYVKLSGEGLTSRLQFSTLRLPFEDEDVAILKLTNHSTVPAEIGNVLITSDAGNYYGKLEDTCNQKSIGLGAGLQPECLVKVKLHRRFGDVAGLKNEAAKLIVNHDNPKQNKTVDLLGSIFPVVGVPGTLAFKEVGVSDECEKVLPVVNRGTGRVRFDKASISGPNKEEFRIVKNTCGDLIGGRRCEITVAFKPSARDARLAVLSIPDSTRAAPHVVNLSGQGVDPLVTISGTISFGNQRVEGPDTVKTFTVLNPGKTAVQVKDVFITGPNKDDFKYLSDTCRLRPVESKCEVEVAYKPSRAGASQASLVVVTADSSGTTSSVTLNSLAGGVYALPAPRVEDTPCNNHQMTLAGAAFRVPQKLCFDPKKVVDSKNVRTRQTRTIPISSQTGTTLAVTASIAGRDKDDFKIEDPNACKDPAKPCTITVGFTPRETDKREAVLALSHDPASPPVNVELVGEGKSRCPVVRAAKWFVNLFKRDKKPCQ